jgi:hypothetical protein
MEAHQPSPRGRLYLGITQSSQVARHECRLLTDERSPDGWQMLKVPKLVLIGSAALMLWETLRQSLRNLLSHA